MAKAVATSNATRTVSRIWEPFALWHHSMRKIFGNGKLHQLLAIQKTAIRHMKMQAGKGSRNTKYSLLPCYTFLKHSFRRELRLPQKPLYTRQ